MGAMEEHQDQWDIPTQYFHQSKGFLLKINVLT
jgi:hypothetical protein